jgi:hypothetical protein
MAETKTKERAAPIMRTEQGAVYMRGTCLDRNGRYAIHRVAARQVSAMVRRGFRFVRHGEPEAGRINATGIAKDASGDAAWFGAVLPVEAETAAIERALHEAVGAERADAYLRRLFNTV